MVCVLFSAIVAERRSELGLLKAIGARRRQIVGLMVIEAMIVTGAGGLIGVVFGELLLRLFARSAGLSSDARCGIPVSLARHSRHHHDRGGMHRCRRIDRRGGSAVAGLARKPA